MTVLIMNRQQAKQYMQEDLSNIPDLLRVCSAIFDYVCSQSAQNLRHVTFGTLSRVAHLENTLDVIPASRYLTGARVPLFDPKFEFIDGSYIEDIPIEDVIEAQKEGCFYHPEKGEPVVNFENKLFLYFTLSMEGKELLNERE